MSRIARSRPSHPPTTFAEYGRMLGLDENAVIEALCLAVRVTWTGSQFRFVGPSHRIGDDATSLAALDELQRSAAGAKRNHDAIS